MRIGSQGSNRKDASTSKKNSGHARDHKTGRRFSEVSCPTLGCDRNAIENKNRKPIKCGDKAPTTCPSCKQSLPKNGFTQ